MRRVLRLGLALFSGLASLSAGAESPRALRGVLDLSGWDFATQGPARLSGEWLFYRDTLLTPGEVRPALEAPPPVLALPDSWNHTRAERGRFGGLGYATHVLRVVLPEHRPPELALRFGEVHSAMRLWVNGALLAERGRVGRDVDEEVPSMRPSVVRVPGAPELLLVMQVSNYSHFEGGPVHLVELGAAETLERTQADATELDYLIMGSCGAISVYYFTLFGGRRREWAHLAFAILTTIITVRVAAIGWHALDWFPALGEMGQMRLDYATLLVAPVAYYVFLRAVFPAEFPRGIALASGAFAAFGLIAALTLPGRLFTLLREPAMAVAFVVTFAALGFVIRAALRNREGAAIMALGGVLVAMATVFDILRRLRYVQGGRDVLPIAGLMLVATHALVLGQRFSRAFRDSEQLNLTLERRVADRTAELERLARTDVLTGLDNRGELMRRGEIEIARAQRHGHQIAVLVVDVDHFKAVNDGHGHATGDEALRVLGRALLAQVRDHDVAGRYGGEEFVLVLPHLDAAGAVAAAERVREGVARAPITVPGGATLSVTASVGVAIAATAESFEDVIKRADAALYVAKASGRNRVVAA